jgi:hypothetical protein
MKYILFFICLYQVSFGQNNLDAFTGVYTGEMVIHNNRGTLKIPLEFTFNKTSIDSIYTYKFVYNKNQQNQVVKDYTLKTIDAKKGKYMVDENNGIILSAFMCNNTLYQMFEVQNNLLTSTLQFTKNQVVFTITFLDKKNTIKTGGTSEEIPEVLDYPITVTQIATLIKETK